MPPDPRRPGSDNYDYFALRRRLQRLIGQPIIFRVRRAGSEAPIDIHGAAGLSLADRHAPADGPDRGGARRFTRGESRRAPAKDGAEEGDVITAVEVTGADGKKQRDTAKPADGDEPLDPMRLPTQLALWAISKPTMARRLTVLRAAKGTRARCRPLWN